jgi:hypothetical protein
MCYADLRSDCFDAPGWRIDLPGDQWSPNVRAFSFFWVEPAWKATFVSRDNAPDGNTVLVRIGDLIVQPNGDHGFVHDTLLESHVPCPDARGYWGDYHDLQFIGRESRWSPDGFLYTFSDSRRGCQLRDQFISRHLHVRGIVQ